MTEDQDMLFRILLHEAAHLVVAQHFGCSSKRIALRLLDGAMEGEYQNDEHEALTAYERRMIALAGRSAESALIDRCTNVEAIAARPLSQGDALGAGAHSLADIAAATDLVIGLRMQVVDVVKALIPQVQEQLERAIAP